MQQGTSTVLVAAWQPPIRPSDADHVSRIIRDSGGIVSAVPELREADWKVFAREHILHDVTFLVTIDSNFMISLLNLFRYRMNRSPMDRRTAALMALAIMFDMTINPTVATYEYASTAEGDPRMVLAQFRHADDFHPQAYADMALDRVTSLPSASMEELTRRQEREPLVPPAPIKGHDAHYTAILGMLAIHTDPAMRPDTIEARKTRMLCFLRWMYSDFIFVGYATLLAALLWGNGPASPLLRAPNTRDPEKLIASAKNTAWDLSLAHVWADRELKRAGQIDVPVNLLFSMDRGVALVAERLIQQATLPASERQHYMLRQLCEFWPRQAAEHIARVEQDYGTRHDEASRRCNSSSWQTYADGLSAELEQRIRRNLGAQ